MADDIHRRTEVRKLFTLLRTATVHLVEAYQKVSQYVTTQKNSFATGSDFEWRQRQYMRKVMHDVAMIGNMQLRLYAPEVCSICGSLVSTSSHSLHVTDRFQYAKSALAATTRETGGGLVSTCAYLSPPCLH